MKRAFLLTAIALVVASPAFAAGGSCSKAPKSAWQPQSKLESMLKTEGLTVKRIKVENGCYEVYATNKTGKRVNVAYNAQTLKKLKNAEAGEH
jgi:hypothetical protein